MKYDKKSDDVEFPFMFLQWLYLFYDLYYFYKYKLLKVQHAQWTMKGGK